MEYEELVRRYNLPWATKSPITPLQKEASSYGCSCPGYVYQGIELDNYSCPLHGLDAVTALKEEDREWKGLKDVLLG